MACKSTATDSIGIIKTSKAQSRHTKHGHLRFGTQILFGAAGHYRSANDPGVVNQSGLLDHFDAYFENKQYVVGDSAYCKTKWCVPIGKSSKHESLTRSDVKLNYLLSRARVVSSIKNCFGALKDRFGFLEELRNGLKVGEDVDGHSR
ncbi:hypothetical protein MUCCIDRAFT_107784 [Mucor lusitanicus CBS 277.49]|uniref:DDE Tnp4 domain-containing protein n=1 Tax=Mucor lusitanicus CBS 277.49 TaxID=747725 RepID=A0A168P555_MUCCL|nr:hypothetical protein MUCCIDRAFT_107784 [Mucor lusitanicus CBS 277.49]